MIRILMLDLGGTLINEDKVVFPHVQEALESIQSFETATQDQLSVCLISDFCMPTPQSTEQSIFQEYITLLESLNLLRFFEPVERHITLSTHTGVFKPDARIFEFAIKRLGFTASLNECLLITENAEHIEVCRSLGMNVLRFAEAEQADVDFNDWSEAPLLISQLVNPKSVNNVEKAIRLRLAVEHNLELISINAVSPDGKISGRVKQWHSLSSANNRENRSSQVPLSTGVKIDLSPQRRILAVRTDQTDKEEIDEANHYVKTLDVNKQISRRKGPLSSGETHRETINEKGEKRIKRERFSAI